LREPARPWSSVSSSSTMYVTSSLTGKRSINVSARRAFTRNSASTPMPSATKGRRGIWRSASSTRRSTRMMSPSCIEVMATSSFHEAPSAHASTRPAYVMSSGIAASTPLESCTLRRRACMSSDCSTKDWTLGDASYPTKMSGRPDSDTRQLIAAASSCGPSVCSSSE
jgi:hypothetical protein